MWGAGMDNEGSFRDLHENCYWGTGTHAPRPEGRSWQDLGNPRYLQRHVPGCGGKEIYYLARNCPNLQLLGRKMRRSLRRPSKGDRYSASAMHFAFVQAFFFSVDP